MSTNIAEMTYQCHNASDLLLYDQCLKVSFFPFGYIHSDFPCQYVDGVGDSVMLV